MADKQMDKAIDKLLSKGNIDGTQEVSQTLKEGVYNTPKLNSNLLNSDSKLVEKSNSIENDDEAKINFIKRDTVNSSYDLLLKETLKYTQSQTQTQSVVSQKAKEFFKILG
jgi:hypothetical protein